MVTGWDNANMQKQIENLSAMFGKEDKANKLISFYNDTTKTVEIEYQK